MEKEYVHRREGEQEMKELNSSFIVGAQELMLKIEKSEQKHSMLETILAELFDSLNYVHVKLW